MKYFVLLFRRDASFKDVSWEMQREGAFMLHGYFSSLVDAANGDRAAYNRTIVRLDCVKP
jgi:hypothetical protein